MPTRFFKLIGADSNFLVVNSMYFMHCILWSFGDYFYYKLVKLIAGTQCAIFTTMISFTNQTVNRYVSRTSMNGVEGNLAIAALYYYHKLISPKIMDSDLIKMTTLITVTFVARSSSLAAWIPLALIKIYKDPRFFVPIFVAGLTVAVPIFILSVGLDSLYYGGFTVP